MKAVILKYKDFYNESELVLSSLIGILFLLASLILNYFAGIYATIRASNPVSDIILSNIPTINTEPIFVDGVIIFLAFVVWLLLKEPKRISFTVKSIAVFLIIRSIFINLTHLGLIPDSAPVNYNGIIRDFTFGGDLFFSAHTGLPFLMALIFWNNKPLRIIFIISSLIFAAAVLLGHLHYSIDVFAAFFITDGIFRIAERLFKKDQRIFSSTLTTA